MGDDDTWLDDAELEELHQLLSGHGGDDDLLLDGVHGLLTAIIIGPDAVAVDEWLPQVLDADKPFESVEAAGRSYALLVRMRDDVERALDSMEWAVVAFVALAPAVVAELIRTATGRAWVA